MNTFQYQELPLTVPCTSSQSWSLLTTVYYPPLNRRKQTQRQSSFPKPLSQGGEGQALSP